MMFLATEGIGAACRWLFRRGSRGPRIAPGRAGKKAYGRRRLRICTYTTWFSRLALSLPKIASIDAHDLGDRVELAESVARIRDDQKDRRKI